MEQSQDDADQGWQQWHEQVAREEEFISEKPSFSWPFPPQKEQLQQPASVASHGA